MMSFFLGCGVGMIFFVSGELLINSFFGVGVVQKRLVIRGDVGFFVFFLKKLNKMMWKIDKK